MLDAHLFTSSILTVQTVPSMYHRNPLYSSIDVQYYSSSCCYEQSIGYPIVELLSRIILSTLRFMFDELKLTSYDWLTVIDDIPTVID